MRTFLICIYNGYRKYRVDQCGSHNGKYCKIWHRKYRKGRHKYFEPVFDDGGKPSAYPLIDYPSGSYYSTRKGGCTCHSWCNWDSNCDCIKFDNSIQCDGFAKYIYYVSHKHNHVTNEKLVYKNKTMNADYAKSLFKGTPTGTYIRVNYDNHSIAIIDTSDSDITIYHANVDNKTCKVKYETITWESFVDRYPNLTSYQK